MAVRKWTDGGADGDWTDTSNWSGAAVPDDGDDVYIEESSRAIETNLNQSAKALASLNIAKNFTGTIGTATAPLQIGSAVVNIGYTKGTTSPAGSGRLYINLGSTTAAAVTIHDSKSTGSDAFSYPIRLLAANASTDIAVRGGIVGIADVPGESATISDLDVSGGRVVVGHVANAAAVTVATVQVTGGQCVTYSGCTTLDADGGLMRTEGSGAITTATNRGSAFTLNSTGTITNLHLRGGSTDSTGTQSTRTVTNATIYRGAVYIFDKDVTTHTNGLVFGDSDPLTVSVG